MEPIVQPIVHPTIYPETADTRYDFPILTAWGGGIAGEGPPTEVTEPTIAYDAIYTYGSC